MIKTTNTKSSHYVNGRVSFKANNLEGDWQDNYYIVRSYKWYPLFIFNLETREWFENSERYSVSTSKQKTQAHPGTETKKLTLAEMKQILGEL